MEKFSLIIVLILVTIIILTSDSQYFPPYESSRIVRTKSHEAICQRQTPTAIYLNAYGDAETELIAVVFGREYDIVRLFISKVPMFTNIGSAKYLLLFKTENGWKSSALLTQKERGDFKKQTAISKEEQVFFQKCFLPKSLI